MGYPMALNLARKAVSSPMLTVYDVNKASIDAFTQETQGAKVSIADSPAMVADQSEVVFTMLPENAHVVSVYDQIVQRSKRGNVDKLFVDCSTIDPFVSQSVANKMAGAHSSWAMVDAPVSGGTTGAKAGTLTFMLGGSETVHARLQSLLLLMGKRVFPCGFPGSGLAAKLANNYLLAINNIATCEAMNLGLKLGLDKHVLGAVINSSTGKCWPSEVNNPVEGVVKGAPAERDYTGGFGVRLMRKDLNLAVEAGRKAKATFKLADAATQMYEDAAKDATLGPKDFSVIYKTIV